MKQKSLKEVAIAVGGTYVGAKVDRNADATALLKKFGFKDDPSGSYYLMYKVAKDADITVMFDGPNCSFDFIYDNTNGGVGISYEVPKKKLDADVITALLDYTKKQARVREPKILHKFR